MLWRERLELLYKQALADVHEQRPGAVTAAVRIAQVAAKLDGLDAPTQVDISNPSVRELEEWVDALMALSRPAIEEGDILAGDDDEILDDDDLEEES